MPSEKALAGAALIGAAGGLRTFTPPAALVLRGRLLPDSPGRYALLAAAAGEFAGDKSPFVPSRTSPPALVGRVASGAFAGRALAGLPGAGLGAAAAGLSTFASYQARKGLTDLSGLPGPVVGLAGDGIAVAAAALATR